VTALERIQTFMSTGKCMVLAGGAIQGRVFSLSLACSSTHYFFFMSLLLNSATKKSTSLLKVRAVPPISQIHKYDNQSDSQDDENKQKLSRQKMNIRCSFYLLHAKNN
jgi:hypothetical protein